MEHTYTLTITGTEHFELQGTLANAGGAPADFRSLLELVKLLQKNMEEEA
jgi:hypothetical protein